MRTALESEGYAVDEARDGDQGVAMASAEQPDLILMGLRLPVAVTHKGDQSTILFHFDH